MKYTFKEITGCNMCDAGAAMQKVLGKRLNKSQGKNPVKLTGITTTIVKCKNCGLVYSNPMPVPDNINDHYGTPPEEYWKASYFEHDAGYYQNQIMQFKKLTEIKPGMKSLDVGAGLGKAMTALKNAGFDSYGFEPSVPFYERAISKMNIPADKLQLASLEEAKYEERFFDFITFGAVLEHLYDPSASLQKALIWLKPGGLIHIEVPSSSWLVSRIANFYYKLTCTDYVANISPMHVPFHLHEFGLKSFLENAKINNYEIAYHVYWVANTYMPKFMDGILTWIMSKTNTGMQLEIWLRKK